MRRFFLFLAMLFNSVWLHEVLHVCQLLMLGVPIAGFQVLPDLVGKVGVMAVLAASPLSFELWKILEGFAFIVQMVFCIFIEALYYWGLRL